LRVLLINRAIDPAKCRTKACYIIKLTAIDISKKVIFPYEALTLDELKAACRAKDASDQGDADDWSKTNAGNIIKFDFKAIKFLFESI
jgi:hypothetical protein